MADVNISKYTTQVVRDGSKPASPGFVVSEGQDPVNPPGTNNYVPYTGATANVDLGEYELKAGQLTLDTSPTGTAVVGTTRWNDTIGSSETTLKGGSVVLKNGVDLVARVVNKVTPNTTLTKAAYQAVRVSGAQGQRLAVAFAQANNDNNSADTIGLVTETIATNQEGFILTVGQLENINTTGSLQGETWSDGDVLYLSPTTPGAITKVKPNGSTGHIIVIGYVEYAHAIHGKIYVKIMNGWELDELHNVYINNPLNNQGLFYTSATQLWENKSIATALGYTPANAATTITINGTTQDLSTNRTYNVGTVTSVGLSSATSGVTIGSTPVTSSGTITIAIATATSTQNGLLSSTDWSTFNGKQNALTLTTTGTSGAATLVGSTLNIPIYSPDLSGYVPTSRTLTINGTTFDLSANRSWSVGTVTSVAALTLGTSGTDLSSTVANSTTTPVITLNVPTASATNRGALSAADWTTFNNKQNALTNPVTGTGASGQVAYFSGTTTITSESNLFWNATNDRLGIGTSSPSEDLTIQKASATSVFIGLKSNSSANQSYIGMDSGGLFQFQTNNGISFYTGASFSRQVDIFGTGNVGINVAGTDSGFKLDVNGTGRFSNILVANSDIHQVSTGGLYWGAASTYVIGVTGNTANGNLSFITGSTVKATITSSGNVGIGTSSPTTKLDVRGIVAAIAGSGSNGLLFGDYGTDAGTFSISAISGRNIVIRDEYAGVERFRISSTGFVSAGATTNGRLGVRGFTNDSSGYSFEAANANGNTLFIVRNDGVSTFTGNVGIGTYSPSTRLFVKGTGLYEGIVIDNSSTTGGGYFGAYQNGTQRAVFGVSATIEGGTSSDVAIFAETGGALRFYVNGSATSSMRLFSTGNLSIGSTSDTGYRLFVSGNTYLRSGGNTSASFGLVIQDSGANNLFLLRNDGQATFSSLGTGTVYSNSGVLTNTNPSDLNLKINVTPINYGLDEILKLNPVTFNWKNDTINQGKQYGFIAQEVQKIMPDLVKQDEYLGLDKEAIFTTLVKAIQELKQEIDTLKNN